jgi:hypothetical protein
MASAPVPQTGAPVMPQVAVSALELANSRTPLLIVTAPTLSSASPGVSSDRFPNV